LFFQEDCLWSAVAVIPDRGFLSLQDDHFVMPAQEDGFEFMRTPFPASDEGHGPEYGRGQLWLSQGLQSGLPSDDFMLNGHLRQTITIVPSRKLVILRMGVTREDIGFSNAPLLRAIVAAER